MRALLKRSTAILLAVHLALPVLPAQAEGLAGAYLAGRQARYDADFKVAAEYYTKALTRDMTNPALMESVVLSNLALGRIDRALPVARKMESEGLKSQISHMVLLADEAANRDFDALLKRVDDKRGIGTLIDGLIRAWALLGKGAMADAVATFDKVSEEKGQRGFGLYHKSLALALVGDFESAEAILGATGPGSAVQTRRGVIARVQVLSQLEKDDEALKVLDDSFGTSLDPELRALREALLRGDTLDFTLVGNAQQGMAEVLYTVAGALRGEARNTNTLLFSRMAEHLDPSHVDAILLSAELLDGLEQYDLATETFRRVPRGHGAYHAAELGRADALRKAGKEDAAIEVLHQLADSHGDLPVVHTTLGDMMRMLDRFEEAIEAYDHALALYGEERNGKWFLYYARGISHERMGDWPKAEADFRTALKIQPGRPEVLNYLGYSMVEKKQNLDEALAMIEEAVAARPNSGYIVDSLGWVLYRLGRYDEAVGHMETAVELMPVDPIVNDHLGDVYWAVGRHLEARFQWKRALSFVDFGEAAEDADPDRIRRKLEVGLDVVLEEEGAPPLKVAGEDG
ncbi:MAG: hypothetical protein CSA70_08270 [Rhodobacterales bacterium]|nr:MAG: hypothetical protein CSA70_08270 [Rhodobacterales bacterium]